MEKNFKNISANVPFLSSKNIIKNSLFFPFIFESDVKQQNIWESLS